PCTVDGPERAPKADKPESDKDALQGAWIEVSRGKDGEKLPEDKRWTLVFDGDKVTVVGFGTKRCANQREGTYTLDADKKPREIDLTLGSLVLNGIYERKGATLKTLWRENDRTGLPANFDPEKGVLIVFQKKTGETKPKPEDDARKEKKRLQGTWKIVSG